MTLSLILFSALLPLRDADTHTLTQSQRASDAKTHSEDVAAGAAVHKFAMNKLADNLLCRMQHIIPLHLLVLPSAAQFSGSLVHSHGADEFVKENINKPGNVYPCIHVR